MSNLEKEFKALLVKLNSQSLAEMSHTDLAEVADLADSIREGCEDEWAHSSSCEWEDSGC